MKLIRCRPQLRLHLTRQELDVSSTQLLSAINPLQLVSCEIINYHCSSASADRSPIQNFLLGKENLEILHLTCTGEGVAIPDVAIEPRERMPAVKELILDGYSWDHSPTTAVKFWNWSRISHLELRRVIVTPFLSTVTPEHLVHLRTFKTDGCFSGMSWDFEVCQLLIWLVRGIKALEHLSIFLHIDPNDNDLKDNLVRAISGHGSSLKSLEFGELKANTLPMITHIPTHPTQMKYVAELRSSLTNVVELSLDFTTIEVEKQVKSDPRAP